MKHFLLFASPLQWKVRKCLFYVSLLNMETNSSNVIMQLINPNYAWKSRVKRIKTTWYKLLQWCIFYPIAKDPDHGGQNAAKFSFFIFANICSIPEWIWFSVSNVFKIRLMDGLDILRLELY